MAKKIKKARSVVQPLNIESTVTKSSPKELSLPIISVIIPMYNAEQYVGECLDSLLAQTFQDFEVIVVDDCSTDNSVETVKGYLPKFNGRLKLSKTQTNSGGCAVPRNVGLPLASGKYIYFMDSDDALTKTGLEEMYTLAKEYDADVVYCERYYMSTGVGEDFIKNIHVATRRVQKPPYVEKPTLESEDLFERVQGILNERYWTGAVFKFVQHDLIKKHNMVFPHVKPSEDDIWTYGLVFFAKRWLRVPNMIYIRRMREDSIMGTTRTPQELLKFWINPALLGMKVLDSFMSQIEFFKENPQQRYAILERHFRGKLNNAFRSVKKHTPLDVYEMIKEAFEEKLGEYDVLISTFCSQMFDQGKTLDSTQQKLDYAERQLATKESEINEIRSSISNVLAFVAFRPDVSVVIAMYNSEKYIGELLDSLLAQTFTNFEVIVVDDCSTDNSVAIVKNYMSKFRGKLKLSKTQKNTGKPGEPRNIGVGLSCGEYLLILDSDDTITHDAIEKLYKVAKEFDADVVACEKFYKIPEEHWNDAEFRKKLEPHSYQRGKFVSEPTLASSDLAQRVQDCYEFRFLGELWDKMVRREFMIENQIRSKTIMSQDYLVVYCLLCTVKTVVRVPYVINFHRIRKDSLLSSHNEYSESLDKLKAYFTTLNVGFNYIDEYLSKREYFQENPQVKRLALNGFFKRIWDVRIKKVYDEVPAHDREEALRKEFENRNNASLIMSLLEFLSDAKKENDMQKAQQTPSNFFPFFTARIDIQLVSTAGDFQILSVSDKKASVTKPGWFQKSGIGYQIQSYAGKLSINAKATTNGQINLKLRGLNIINSNDKSKRIPYWIDYTKLVVNDNSIFDTLTPTWHDKYFTHNMKVNADEEITIQVEWQPHRSDT
ncbi:MAG: glycosyltransferase [Quinella sp. 1Q5]|nr:glycosyltransferase [Quinella sp. 1Q5]